MKLLQRILGWLRSRRAWRDEDMKVLRERAEKRLLHACGKARILPRGHKMAAEAYQAFQAAEGSRKYNESLNPLPPIKTG